MNSTHKTIPSDVVTSMQTSYAIVASIVEEAWRIWQAMQNHASTSIPTFIADNRMIGTCMNTILRSLFKQREPGLDGIDFVETNDIFLVIVDKAYALRFNMMDKAGKAADGETKQSQKYLDGEMEIPGFEPEKLLYAGYLMSDAKTELINFYILERDANRHPLWIMDRHHPALRQGTLSFGQSVSEKEQQETQPRRKRASLKTGINHDNVQPKTGTDSI